ncbi:MAG: RNA-binding transcriptional accessory protein [Clostridia bacterium]|nr:RNA-binding transcriptional accessory protein [Clostridia bacterium]
MDISSILQSEFGIKKEFVNNIISLIDDGNTIPFIARYRKEMHGSCDDQVLRDFADRLNYLRNFEKRKEEIINSITEQEKMTDEIMSAIEQAQTLAALEDIYRPYKQKRRTRATVAKEKGLEPLADQLMEQKLNEEDFVKLAETFIDLEKGVESSEDAINGACDIIAEIISDDAAVRGKLRDLFTRTGDIVSVAAKEEDSVYSMYYEYREPVRKIPSHRILAINRGEAEEFLKVSVEVDEGSAIKILTDAFVTSDTYTSELVLFCANDSYKRLIFPSVEREIRSELTANASEQAIKIFGLNLKPLLMQPPIKGKVTLGLDPAYRTGCKIAVVDAQGKVLDTTVIYPTPPQNKTEEAKEKLKMLISKHNVDVISIGNGTASKESEMFVADLIKELDRPVSYMMVNEAGASVYSASKLGAQEFPDFDVSLRSAVSIARRLQDPLAELVKIDPKSIGVGQYQHDLPEKRLDETLCGVVETCVNSVGVDLNTASPSLLSYVSGITSAVSKNIVAYREENGEFTSRAELKKVPKLGPKAYEQCAGFLRIPNGKNILDNTSVHPESYDAAKKMLDLFGFSEKDVTKNALNNLKEKVQEKGLTNVAEILGIGVPTLKDIIEELLKPGRDLRDELPPPMLRSDILSMEDLKPGMELKGTVRNVVDFGAFVDIAVHQDGLVHISQITNRYIKHPSEVLKVGDVVTVWVLSVDVPKKRISLTMLDKNKDRG